MTKKNAVICGPFPLNKGHASFFIQLLRRALWSLEPAFIIRAVRFQNMRLTKPLTNESTSKLPLIAKPHEIEYKIKYAPSLFIKEQLSDFLYHLAQVRFQVKKPCTSSIGFFCVMNYQRANDSDDGKIHNPSSGKKRGRKVSNQKNQLTASNDQNIAPGLQMYPFFAKNLQVSSEIEILNPDQYLFTIQQQKISFSKFVPKTIQIKFSFLIVCGSEDGTIYSLPYSLKNFFAETNPDVYMIQNSWFCTTNRVASRIEELKGFEYAHLEISSFNKQKSASTLFSKAVSRMIGLLRANIDMSSTLYSDEFDSISLKSSLNLAKNRELLDACLDKTFFRKGPLLHGLQILNDQMNYNGLTPAQSLKRFSSFSKLLDCHFISKMEELNKLNLQNSDFSLQSFNVVPLRNFKMHLALIQNDMESTLPNQRYSYKRLGQRTQDIMDYIMGSSTNLKINLWDSQKNFPWKFSKYTLNRNFKATSVFSLDSKHDQVANVQGNMEKNFQPLLHDLTLEQLNFYIVEQFFAKGLTSESIYKLKVFCQFFFGLPIGIENLSNRSDLFLNFEIEIVNEEIAKINVLQDFEKPSHLLFIENQWKNKLKVQKTQMGWISTFSGVGGIKQDKFGVESDRPLTFVLNVQTERKNYFISKARRTFENFQDIKQTSKGRLNLLGKPNNQSRSYNDLSWDKKFIPTKSILYKQNFSDLFAKKTRKIRKLWRFCRF